MMSLPNYEAYIKIFLLTYSHGQ